MNNFIKPETGRFYAFGKGKSTRRGKSAGTTSGDDKTVSIINTDSIDRHGTIIEPSGGDIKSYLENPVFLINHDHDLLAGTSTIKMEDNKWISEVNDSDWDDNDERIVRYKNKVKNNIMRMTSVGIIPLEVEDITIERGEGEETVPHIKQWELLEWSYVSVGSNPDALIQSRRFGNDIAGHFEALNKKLDQILNRELKLNDNQIDALIQTFVERSEPSPKPSPQPEPPRSARTFDENKLAEMVVKTVNQKLGKR